MVAQTFMRFVAHPCRAASAWLMLLLIATRLSAPLDGDGSIVAFTSNGLPRILLGACDRNLISGALWRLRNHPVSEAIVAKSSLLTHGDVYSVSRIAELGNNIGIGFQYMLNWLETLSVPQQVYVWKLFAGAEATQSFLSKFQGAEHLYGEGTAQRVLQRLKFVLLDGKIDIPSTVGVERLFDEAMGAYKAAFFTFAGELSEAISRTDIVVFEKKLHDHLPLLKEVLAGLLSLCVRLDDSVTKEYRTTLGRWILKLFRLDSAALLLSPFSPPDQVLERKILSDMSVDTRVGPSQVLGCANANGSTSQQKPCEPVSAGDDSRSAPPEPAPETLQQTQGHVAFLMPQFSSAITFSGRQPDMGQTATTPASTTNRTFMTPPGTDGRDSFRPASLLTLFGASKPPVLQGSATTSSTYPMSTMLATKQSLVPGTKLAPTLSGSTMQPPGSSTSSRIKPPEDLWAFSVVSKANRGSSSMREESRDTLSRGTMHAQRASGGPGSDTLTSMAALLRAEAEMSKYSAPPKVGFARSPASAGTLGAQETYSLNGYTLDTASRRASGGQSRASSRPVSSDGQGTILQGTSTETGRGRGHAPAGGRRGVQGVTEQLNSSLRREASTGGGETLAPAGHTMHYLFSPDEQATLGLQGMRGGLGQQGQTPAKNRNLSAHSTQNSAALRAGSPLSAGELQSRMHNVDKVMQSSKKQGDFEAAAGALEQKTMSAGQRQTLRGTLDPAAKSSVAPRPPSVETDTMGRTPNNGTAAARRDKGTNAGTADGQDAATQVGRAGWEAAKTLATLWQKTSTTIEEGSSPGAVAAASIAEWKTLRIPEIVAGSGTEASRATTGRSAVPTSKAADGWGTLATSASTTGGRASVTSAAGGGRESAAKSAAAGEDTSPAAPGQAGPTAVPSSAAAARGETGPSSRVSAKEESPALSAVHSKQGAIAASAAAGRRGVMSPSEMAAEWERLRNGVAPAGRDTALPPVSVDGQQPAGTSKAASGWETLKRFTWDATSPLTRDAAEKGTLSPGRGSVAKGTAAATLTPQAEWRISPASGSPAAQGARKESVSAPGGKAPATSAARADQEPLRSRVAAVERTLREVTETPQGKAQPRRSSPPKAGTLAAFLAKPPEGGTSGGSSVDA